MARPKNGKVISSARSFGMFKPKERLIYAYWDGKSNRRGDPLLLLRGLTDREGLSLEVDAKLATGATPEAPKALGRLVEAVRDVFGVKPLDQGGMTEAECLGLLFHFMQYITEVQRDFSPLPTSPPPTDSPAANGSTTGPGVVSGCAETAP